MQKNRLIIKRPFKKLLSRIMASQAVQLIIKTHIFPNISRSKGNQSMNFAQLTEYNVRKLFFSENHAKMRQGD